jgi:hypothetical protein
MKQFYLLHDSKRRRVACKVTVPVNYKLVT